MDPETFARMRPAAGALADQLRIGSSFAEPDGIVMHPTTWGIIRRRKDSTGQYLLAADPSQSWMLLRRLFLSLKRFRLMTGARV